MLYPEAIRELQKGKLLQLNFIAANTDACSSAIQGNAEVPNQLKQL